MNISDKNRIGISIIVPFFNGNQYIQRVYKCIESICKQVENIEVELIIINDSPEIDITEPSFVPSYKYFIINNKKNSGIHYSRVNGLKHASKEWIQFLDQDDSLVPEEYSSQVTDCRDYDWIVGNGINVYDTGVKKFYRNKKEMEFLIRENTFLKGRCYIRSPGQCLIKKQSIPIAWTQNFVECNGADDLFLWMLMLADKPRIKLNDRIIYHHNQQNGENLSLDHENMRMSSLEVCDKLEKCKDYSKLKAAELRTTCEFRYAYHSKDKSHIGKKQYYALWIREAAIYVTRRIRAL